MEKLEPVFVFKGHTREVLELDTHPKEPFSIFASAVSVKLIQACCIGRVVRVVTILYGFGIFAVVNV